MMHFLALHNFLSAEECKQFIALGKSKQMERTRGFYQTAREDRVTDFATCSQHTFALGENELVSSLERRIARATGYPVEYGEGLRILHYPQGAHMGAHHDYYSKRYAGDQGQNVRGGQIVMTFMVYLNTIPPGGGGETSFMDINLKARPEEGKAFVWWNLMPNGEPDPSTHHEALPPKEGNEKWILNKWIHERPI